MAPTLPSPTMSCALCKRVRPIPRAKPFPSGTLGAWILPKRSHPGQVVPGRAPRVQRRRRQPCSHGQHSVCRGSVRMPSVCCGFALLGRQNSFCVASSGMGRQQRGGQPSPEAEGHHPPHGALGLPTPLALWAVRCWPVLGATQRFSVGAVVTLSSCPCVQRAVPAQCVPGVPCGYTWMCTQQAACSAASPVVEVSCGALPCPCHCLRGLCGLTWHLTSSAVCTEVSAAVAPGDKPPAPLVLGPCAVTVCVRASPVLGL